MLKNRFGFRKQEGATAVEYALIVGILGLLIVAAFGVLGASFEGVFDTIAAAISGGGSTPTPTP
ncbi:MAG: Flp family type IVb pilin [Panacagrimonas sp.]